MLKSDYLTICMDLQKRLKEKLDDRIVVGMNDKVLTVCIDNEKGTVFKYNTISLLFKKELNMDNLVEDIVDDYERYIMNRRYNIIER